MGLTACGAYPDPIGAVAHKKGQASVTTLANRGPLPFRRFSTARCEEITSAFYSFVVISHMIRHATRLASDSPPPLFPCQLSSKSFRPKLLRTLFALSHATARSKPCVFSCLRTHCRRNGVVWVCLTKFLRSHSTFSRPLTRLPAVGGPAHRGGQLSCPVFIYLLFFLYLAHSFAQRAHSNSLGINGFRTLSIATGVYALLLSAEMWNCSPATRDGRLYLPIAPHQPSWLQARASRRRNEGYRCPRCPELTHV